MGMPRTTAPQPAGAIAMARRRRGRPIHGWLVIDKPADMTSTDVVSRVRRMLDAAKVGHAGTLDPMATGVLPLAFGEATKTVSFAMDGRKSYRFTVRWGIATNTDDAEGSAVAENPMRPNADAITAVLPRFVGLIDQVPPAFSAIKVQGERAYDLARDGEPVTLPPRLVRIDAIRLVDCPDADHAVLEADCGKGTYMRALARDIAAALGTLGHLATLCRTRVGPFLLDAAIGLPQLHALVDGGEAISALLPVDAPLDDIPAVTLTQPEAHRLRRGQPVSLLRRSDRDRLAALSPSSDCGHADGVILARFGTLPVALTRLEGAELKPVRVLNLQSQDA